MHGLLPLDLWSRLLSSNEYGAVLALVKNSVIAGAVLGLTGVFTGSV